MSPAGRLESHQRGFWIETPFQMQKTKALSWLFPECVRRVEKQSTKACRLCFFGGYLLRKYQGEALRFDSPCPSDLCHMTLSQVGFLTLAPGKQLFVRPPQTVILLFLYFFFLRMVLIPVSCTMSGTSIHNSSGTLSSRSSPLNLFLTSTVQM